MPNQQDPNFNKNVSMVYVEEPGFTGYKGFDFNKIDNIEDILREGITTGSFGTNSYLSGITTVLNGISGVAENIDNKIFATGDPWPAGVQGTIVFQADLTQQFDGVTTFPEQSASINNFTPSGTNGMVLSSNQFRREFYVQNLSTGILYVKYGTGIHSSSFNFILAGCTTNNAGDGGSLADQSYNGDVSVSGVGNINYISWERSSSRVPMPS